MIWIMGIINHVIFNRANIPARMKTLPVKLLWGGRGNGRFFA
jgi:hypothetical protein